MQIYYNTYTKEGIFLRKINKEKIKNEIKDYEYLKGVSCIIVQNNKILFEKRSNNQDGSNLMDFCSGHIDNDETPKEAMIRELKEELGIPLEYTENLTELKTYPVIVERRQSQKNWVMTIFSLEIPNDFNLKIQESEVKSIEFLSFKDAFNLIKDDNQLQFPYDDNMKKILDQINLLYNKK